MTCRVCGLELPAYARFCARCGTQQPAPKRDVDVWVLAVFGLGIAVSATIAVLYAAIAYDPIRASSGLDPATLRAGSAILSATMGVLCIVQAVAVSGLVRGRDWGRVVATIACVMWSITCVGIPIAVLVLNSIWRKRLDTPGVAAPRPLF